jgi:hypothetical protein
MDHVNNDRRLISSDLVEGTTVYSPNGDNIGSINHLMIEKVSGKVAYAVIGFGGLLGMGESHHPVPWSSLKYDTRLDGYVTGITADQLRDAPEFSNNAWGDPAYEDRVHKHYGVAPYYGVI